MSILQYLLMITALASLLVTGPNWSQSNRMPQLVIAIIGAITKAPKITRLAFTRMQAQNQTVQISI